MCEVIVEEQLQLVNIVEVVQTKLTHNFNLLLKRLNKHDSLLAQNDAQSVQSQSQNLACFKKMEQAMEVHNLQVNQRMQELLAKIKFMEGCQKEFSHENREQEAALKRMQCELSTTQLQFEEKQKLKQLEFEEVTKTMGTLLTEQSRLGQEISNKQSKVESEKTLRQLQILKEKNSYLQREVRLANHKIQKIEILKQKAEREQSKKEADIMSEMEDRIRKEIKVQATGQATNTGDNCNSSFINPNHEESISNQCRLSLDQDILSINQERLGSFKAEEKQNMQPFQTLAHYRVDSVTGSLNQAGSEPLRNNMDSLVDKWGEKIKYLQSRLKEVVQNLKVLNRHEGRKGEVKQSSSESFNDKVNQIKPEIVKLWAKIDTVEDRVCFNERKLDEKTKCINELATLIKDNSVFRLQQKLKILQTQNFANLKELRGKLQGKVNQSEYDKYCRSIQEQVGQTNELIYLKSDKLQVKRALLFLQSKIKQIILVISQEEENEKDALLTKKQLKCISCDKELGKFSGVVSASKGNWDGLPFKDHPPEILGRFGMTNFGSLSKKIKKLEGKDLPVLTKRASLNQSMHNSPNPCKQ